MYEWFSVPTLTDIAVSPILADPVVIGTSVTVSWDHTDKGPCFNNFTFSYNITWYPVVGGVSQRGEGQSVLTGPGATEYNITNLMKDTDYQVELFGFTPIPPPVFSSVATVNFTTTGVWVGAGVYLCIDPLAMVLSIYSVILVLWFIS